MVQQGTWYVKGLQGFYHATNNEWTKDGKKLKTVCGKVITPCFRGKKLSKVNCSFCRERMHKEKEAV